MLPNPTMTSGWLAYQHALQHWWTDLLSGAPGPLSLIGLGIIAISVLIGVWRGFSAEVLGLAAWTAAFVLTALYYGRVEPWLEMALTNRMVAYAVALLGTFFIILLICRMLARFVSRLILLSPFGGIDRVLGGGFGAVRGLMIVMVLYAAASWTLPTTRWASLLGQSAMGYNAAGQGSLAQTITGQISHFVPQLPKFVPSTLALPGRSRHDLAGRSPSDGSDTSNP